MSVVVEVVTLEKGFQSVAAQVEMSFYHAPFVTTFYALRIGTLTEQHPDGTKDDAFAGSCLARNHGKARIKGDVELVNQREMFDI